MEKINHELLLLAHSRANVMEVAARWGVPNRAALLSGYRKYYTETPSDSVVAAALAAALAESEPGPVVSQAEVAGSSSGDGG
jgi:AraC-like DNA-binding protein